MTEHCYCPKCLDIEYEVDLGKHGASLACREFTVEQCQQSKWRKVTDNAPEEVHARIALMEMGAT